MTLLTPIGIAALVLGGGVNVRGTTTCPDASAVQALISSEGPEPAQRTPDRAELSREAGNLTVRLLDGHGDLLAARQLDGASSCAALAQAAAAVISAMELEVWGVPQVDEVPLAPAKSKADTPAEVLRSNPAPRRAGSLGFDVGAVGLAAADSGGRSTWVLGLTLTLAPSSSHFRPQLGVLAAGPRNLPVDGGKVGYQRFWLSLGSGYELKWGRWALEPRAELLGALLRLQGDGTTSVVDEVRGGFGGEIGVTGRWSFGPGALWVGVFGLWWWEGTQVQIGPTGVSRALPPWEVLLGGGIRFGTG